MSRDDSDRGTLEKMVAETIRSMAVNAAWKSAMPVLAVIATIIGSAYYVGQRVTQMEGFIKAVEKSVADLGKSLEKSVADLGTDLKEIRKESSETRKEYGDLLKEERGRSTIIKDTLDRIEKTVAQNATARKTQ